MSLIVKVLLSLLSLALSAPATDKTQCFLHLSFNSALQAINGISTNLQKLLKYFNDTAIVAFLKIPLGASGAGFPTLYPNNLALYLEHLKLLVLECYY